MKFITLLLLGSVTVFTPAQAFTGWVCSERPPTNIATAELPDQTELYKYKIVGDKLETVLDNRTAISGTQMGSPFTYQIVTDNSLGLVAILTDVNKYASGPEVWADVILIDKTRSMIKHFSGSTADPHYEVETGPCTTY